MSLEDMYIVLCVVLALTLIIAVILSIRKTQLEQRRNSSRSTQRQPTSRMPMNSSTVNIPETSAVIVTNPLETSPGDPVVVGIPV